MKKILVFGLTETIGGIETFFMTNYRKLDFSKYQVDFATVFNPMVFESEIREKGSIIFHLTNFKKNPLKYAKEIKEILEKNSYDTVYINMLSAANIMPLKIASKIGIKNIIIHSHNSNTPSNIMKKTLHFINKKKLLKNKPTLVACSEKAGKWMFGKNPFTVLNNAIDLNKFKFDKKYSQEIEHSSKEYIVGHIGRFSEQKNQDFILNIAKNINDKSIKIVLVGEGEDKERICNTINSEKIDNIIVMNPREDVYKLYNSFDLFILPSKFEGLPIVGIEAQANGLPCLFSDKITTELKINDNVKFIPIDNPINWVNAIEKKPIRCNDSSVKLREQGYDIDKNYLEFEKILNKR